MNVAIFSDSFFPQINGVSFSIKNISLELKKRGHKVLVFAPSPEKKDFQEEVEGVQTAYFSSFSLPSYKEYKIILPAFKKALNIAREFKADLVWCDTPFGMGRTGQKIAANLKL